jgi:hypothetical protein
MCSLTLLGVLLVCWPDPQPPGAGSATSEADPLGIQATQLTVRLGQEQFRATVLAKEGSEITVLTAAHCIAERDVGKPLAVRFGSIAMRGEVSLAAHNPDYKPVPVRDPNSKGVRGVLCVDNAVARLRLTAQTPQEQKALEQMGTVDLVARPIVGERIQTLTVHIIDQQGRLHVVTAGNHLNPRCLVWGNSPYRTLPGDSGAGVFVALDGTNGKQRPILVGNVALSDDRGGIGPLVSRASKWLDPVLAKIASPAAP